MPAMVGSDRLSLAELAERTGVEPRTLRSWVQQGLVPGPDRRGRDARYPPAALARALAVKLLRERYGLPLAAVRRRLLVADPERVRAWAAEAEAGTAAAAAPPPPGTAAAYLAALRRAGLFRGGAEASAVAEPAGADPAGPGELGWASGSGVERLRELLEAAVDRPVPRRARAEVWLRIPVTADVELAVRGELAPDHIARLERIVDLVRALLTGGLEHE